MGNIEDSLKELKEEIDQLDRRYLDQYFPVLPEQTADVFEYDVKSYCVLAHACFEEFVEQVSENVLNEIPKDFKNKKISLSTAALLMIYADKPAIDVDEDLEIDTCFEMVRKALDDCKSRHSVSIKDNHGFSIKYLRKLLVPVGLNARFGPTETDAIKKLSKARGSFAHGRSKKAIYGEYKRATTPMSPDDAKEIVKDCLRACEMVKELVDQRW